MKTKIKEGNYAKLGVCQEQEWTNFTFCGEKEDKCYVVLTNTINGTINRIEVPQAYYVGSLRSIAVADLSLEDEEYYFEINGQKVMDPCAHAVMGRYIWNDKTRKEHDYEVCGAFVTDTFDWEEDVAPEIAKKDMVTNAAKFVCKWDETFGSYLGKKLSEGKHYNVAVSHATKKLVRTIYRMEMTKQSYNPQ